MVAQRRRRRMATTSEVALLVKLLMKSGNACKLLLNRPLGLGALGSLFLVRGAGLPPFASRHSDVNIDIGSGSAASVSIISMSKRQKLQSNSNGVSNQCLDRAANVLPDSPPVSTVAALARITNTVAHDESFASKRRRLQHSHGVLTSNSDVTRMPSSLSSVSNFVTVSPGAGRGQRVGLSQLMD